MFKIIEIKMYPKQQLQGPQEPTLINWYFHFKPPACCENVFKEFDIKLDEIKTALMLEYINIRR
jgi:hypothetical protein